MEYFFSIFCRTSEMPRCVVPRHACYELQGAELIIIAHRISHRTNVVVVSANSNFFLLLFDWMFTTTTFIPWDILWAMLIGHVWQRDSRAYI